MKMKMTSFGPLALLVAWCCVIPAIRIDWGEVMDMSAFDTHEDSMKEYRRNQEVNIYKNDTIEATGEQTGTVLFLHGKGMTGRLMKELVRIVAQKSNFPHLKILFPTAPATCWQQTMWKSTLLNVWLHSNRTNPEDDDIGCEEDMKWIERCTKYISQIIQREYFAGIPLKRIIVGGYQSGGAMAMHYGLRVLPQIGGIFALSSYLYNKSNVYKHLDENRPKKLPPLFYYCGDRGMYTPLKWAQITAAELKKRNVTGHYEARWNQEDTVTDRELFQLWLWIERVLPSDYALSI